MPTTITASVTKRLFIPTGIDTPALLGPQLAKFADKYNYLLHYLISARCIDQRLTAESWIPVHSKIFEKYITTRHTANVLRFWLDHGIIEREPAAPGRTGYVVGQKSISYRFTAAYRHARVVDVGYLDEKFEQKVARITKEFRTGKMDLTVKANAFLHFNLRELRINAVAAHQIVNRKLATGAWDVEKANIATVRIQAIREGDWFCTRDTTGHRVHHNFATLNKVLRPACYLETGETLVNIDVKNSQPVILSILLKQHYKNALPADVRRYIELCEAGRFYEFVAQAFGIDITDDEARTAFKKKLFKTIFYGRNQAAEKYPEWACFQAEFPSVAAFITEFKATDYTALSIALQRLESEIMIEGVVGKIAQVHNPEDFFALTIHDSITTTESNQAYVLDLMRQEFRLRGINPSFDTQAIN